MVLQSYNPDCSMQGPAAAKANSATPFTTAGRVEQVGTWWCGYCRSFFRLRRQCAAVNGETSRSGCRGKGRRIGFCVLAHRRTFLADVWNRAGGSRNRGARHERPYIYGKQFALANLIDTNKPKGRPSSLANGIRQCHAWKRRDGSCWTTSATTATYSLSAVGRKLLQR